MGEILPRGEDLRRAVSWIAAARKERADARLATLIEEASQRFDLSPLDQEYLWRTLKDPPAPE